MKVTVFALLLVAVSAYALPEEYETDTGNREQRIVENQIRRAIEQLSRDIVAAGWDPKLVDRVDVEFSPFPLVNVAAFLDTISFLGASKIAIHDMDYNAFLNRLRFDISLPELNLSVGNAGFTANILGNAITGKLRGRIIVSNLGLSGEVRVNVGIISGISIRSLSVNLRHPVIQSYIAVIFHGEEISDRVNNVLNVVIPNLLESNRAAIDQRLTEIIRGIADDILGNNAILPEEIGY